jgi:hypothetical protein
VPAARPTRSTALNDVAFLKDLDAVRSSRASGNRLPERSGVPTKARTYARCTCTKATCRGYDLRMRHFARVYALLVGAAGLIAVGLPVARAVLRRMR